MRRPSIMFLNRVYPSTRGATGRVLRDLARAFAREGWHVTVVTSGPVPGRERDGSIRVIRLKGPEKPRYGITYLWVWLKITLAALRQPPATLVVTLSDPPLLVCAGALIKKFRKSRHIHWCHDMYPDLFPVLGYRLTAPFLGLMHALSRRAMASADKLIVIGRCMARNLTLEGLSPKSITFIPNWPDLELVDPSGTASRGRSAPASVHVTTDPSLPPPIMTGPRFRILYAGNIGRAHPVETILDAAAILNEDQPDIEFLFVGDGPRYDWLARERSRRGLDNIRLLPFQPVQRLRELMESGDLHLMSMNEDAAGMLVPSKLYAALSVQRPSIFVGPAQSEVAKVINDFNAGSVVEQGDAAELAQQIKRFRLDGPSWFAAHDGAAAAAKVYVPKEAIDAWIDRAWSVVQQDLRFDTPAASSSGTQQKPNKFEEAA